jgi:organic hydroperoxide reductase OsmC/OhrA
MKREHHYKAKIEWTGNTGSGTVDYASYARSHNLLIDGKQELQMSSDKPFRGDITKHNPEDLLLASLSSCHMLWYLHLCADAGVNVISYIDHAEATMQEKENGGGFFSEVILRPEIVITGSSKTALAIALHDKAHEKCFIASSCNFPVIHKPLVQSVNSGHDL